MTLYNNSFVLTLSHVHTIWSELPLSNNTGVVVVKHILDFIDAFTVIVFSAEIVLKWIDNFFTFWKDYWNVFDLIVTILVHISLVLRPLPAFQCCFSALKSWEWPGYKARHAQCSSNFSHESSIHDCISIHAVCNHKRFLLH